MKLVIISGRSGSGKSTALDVLEDMGFYCIDNLPAGLLPHLSSELPKEHNNTGIEIPIAISIDARNTMSNFAEFPALLTELEQKIDVHSDVIYLDANSPTLIKRFSETRRKHPLSSEKIGLKEAIALEKEMLAPIAGRADLTIDTSTKTLHDLRDLIKKRVQNVTSNSMSLLFQSFGFKRGIPVDADLVYDVRCLPNPYWNPDLRSETGLDDGVKAFLGNSEDVNAMLSDIKQYLDRWLPHFQANNRSYMTVAIGCTGGQHRSVFISEALRSYFAETMDNVQVWHRELP